MLQPGHDVSETLRAANLALVRSLDLDSVLETLLDYLHRLVPYDSACVMLLDDGVLAVRATRGYESFTDAELTRHLTFDPGSHANLRTLIERSAPVILDDTQADPDWDRRFSPHIRNWMGVPLLWDGGVVGLYSLDKVEPCFFTSQHRELAEALAAPATIAIQNARLTTRLQKTVAEQQVILDAAPTLIWYKDRHNRCLRANRAAAASLGLTPADVEGRSTYDLFPEDAARFYDDDLDVMLSGRPKLGIVDAADTPSGERRYYLTDKIPYRDDAGTIIGVIVFAQDITARRNLEEQLRRVQKMEAAGRLAGGLAHDFNNLLTAILGYGDLLLARLPDGDPLRRHAEEIRKAAERASSLTRQLLAFSRKQVLVPEVVDLNALLSDLETMLRRLVGERIELALELGAGLDRVLADPGQIEQVVINLVLNARDAMPRGGKLGVATRNVELDEGYVHVHIEATPGPHVVLEVKDTGIGMDAETASHIFEPFFTTKELGKGTGLGLASVYGIVKQSNGHIAVETEPGKGSRFRVLLPRTSAELCAASAASQSEAPDRGSETILLVEDEDMVRRVTRELLERRGYRVIEATTGEEAMRVVEAHQGPLQLLLSDVVLPGISGPEIAQRLRRSQAGIRVLYISGQADDPALLGGIDGPLLAKPFSPKTLAARVREILDAPA
jgi:PAS domain S-box-containing protein